MVATHIERYLDPDARARRRRLRMTWLEEALAALWQKPMKPDEAAIFRDISERLRYRAEKLWVR